MSRPASPAATTAETPASPPGARRLGQLAAEGVAVWLDDISRDRLASGSLAELVRTSLVTGVTSNPTIFANALRTGTAYDKQLAELVAPGTVNTMPEATIEAVADHAPLRGDTVHGTYDDARQTFAGLEQLGIRYDEVTAVLEDEGLTKFSASWTELLATIGTELRRARLAGRGILPVGDTGGERVLGAGEFTAEVGGVVEAADQAGREHAGVPIGCCRRSAATARSSRPGPSAPPPPTRQIATGRRPAVVPGQRWQPRGGCSGLVRRQPRGSPAHPSRRISSGQSPRR